MPTDITKLPLREVLYAGRSWKTGQPIRFSYRETRLWPETLPEPSGEWLVLAKEGEEHDGWLRFRQPLVLEWGSWNGPKSWSHKLWRLLQRKGSESTQLLQRLRYDGIVTIRWDRPYQILNLTGVESPWSLETPGILQLREQCRTLYMKEFANLDRQYPRTRDLLTAPELSALFGQHLKLYELEEAHEALWGAWEASTSSPPALHLCGFLSNLGVSGRPLDEDSEEHRKMGLDALRMQEVVEHQYAFLQALLEQTGKRTAKVYRSVYQQTIQSRWLTTFTREASSWSLSLTEALQGETTLGAVIPVERLLLVPGTRISQSTPVQEVVVLGSPDVVNVRWEHPNAKQSGRQMLDLDARDENWLVPQRFAKSARLARLRKGNAEVFWKLVIEDLQGFNAILQQVQKWKRLKSPEAIRKSLNTPQNLALLQKIAWGEEDAHPAALSKPLGKWLQKNFEREWNSTLGIREPISDALLTHARYIWNVLAQGKDLEGWTPGPLVAALEAYRDKVNAAMLQVGPVRFTYAGFKVYNPDRLTDNLVTTLLSGVDHTLALFKQRGVENILRDSLQEILLRFQKVGEETAVGWYFAQDKIIELLAYPGLGSGTGRLTQNWIMEVFLHEMGHHVHLSFLHPAAKAEWDSGWAPVEEAKRKQQENIRVTQEDRRRFFNLIKSQGWSPQKAGQKLKGIDKAKYLAWLYEGMMMGSKLISTPTQVRLTDYGTSIFGFLADPKGVTLSRYPPEDGYSETERQQYQKQRTEKIIENLGLNESAAYPMLREKIIEKIRAEDHSVDEAITALSVPSNYAKTNEKEDFAESFVAFIANPGALSDNAKYRMQRALAVSGLYGKQVMRLASRRKFRS